MKKEPAPARPDGVVAPPVLPRFLLDEAAAYEYVKQSLWGREGPACPHCGAGRVFAKADGRTWRCNVCRRDFSIRSGTALERSHLPLHLWLRAMYLAADPARPPSSARLGRELGIRQASAWSLLRRLRAPGGNGLEKLSMDIVRDVEAAPVGKKTRKDVAMALTRQDLAGKIYSGIKDGTLRLGDRLPPEREIAARFQTGRGLVREALIVLETLGFIEVRGKAGIFIRTLSEEDCNRSLDVYSAWPTEMLPHTFQVRLLMESEAAGLAALHRTDEDLRRLSFCIQGFTRIVRERPDDWNVQGSHLNDLFHKLVIEAAHNPVLLRIHESLLRIIKRAYATFGADSMITPIDQWEERVIKGHWIIADAIAAGNERAARDLMRNHLEITFTKLDAFYRERIKGVLDAVAG